MNKFLKLVGAVVLGLNLVGCVSIQGEAKNFANSKTEGIIYGAAGLAFGDSESDNRKHIKDMCDAINNKDSRCTEQDKYMSALVLSKFGYADGAVGMRMLVPKDFPNLEKLNHKMRTGNSKIPYAKVKVISGQFGELLEIVSVDGDGKCYWSGMPRAGGTVCPEYNYDYRKDFIGVEAH